jgi:PAT family beta-lactamase induction signal transducer AmpG
MSTSVSPGCLLLSDPVRLFAQGAAFVYGLGDVTASSTTAPTLALETEMAQPDKPTEARVKPDTAWAASTYFAEGLPFSIVHKVSSEYLVHANVSAEVIGLANLAHLPWNLKFVWAPLVDRFSTTKRWMVVAQLAIAAATLFLAAFAATFVPWAFAVALCLIAVFAATNDIAIDGYYLRRLPPERQGALTGVRIGAYRVALMVGSGGIVTLGGVYGFPLAFTVAGLLLGALGVGHAVLLAKDDRGEVQTSVARVVTSAGRTFFAQRGIGVALVVLVTYRAGDALMFGMNAKFLSELGLDTATRGIVNGTFGTVASIAGSLAGAWAIARYTFERAFVPLTMLQSAAILLYAFLAATRPGLPVISAVVLVEQLIAGAGTASLFVFLMRLCKGEQKATQYAFASSMMSLAVLGAGATSGFLFTRLGSTKFFVVAFLASIPGVLASLFVKLEPAPAKA